MFICMMNAIPKINYLRTYYKYLGGHKIDNNGDIKKKKNKKKDEEENRPTRSQS